MKKILLFALFFTILSSFLPSESKVYGAEITIKGGDFSEPSRGEGEGMRINLQSSVWRIKNPGSSFTLYNLRTPNTIKAEDAAAYLCADAGIGYTVKNRSLLDINKIIDDAPRNNLISHSITPRGNKIDYSYTASNFLGLPQTYSDSMVFKRDYVKPENGYFVWSSNSDTIYRGKIEKDVWISWQSKPYPSSGIPLSTWSNMDWSAYPLSKYASMSIWRALKGIPRDDVLPSGTPTIVSNSSGSLIYGNASGVFEKGFIDITKELKKPNSLVDINNNTKFEVYIKSGSKYLRSDGELVDEKTAHNLSVNSKLLIQAPINKTYSVEEKPSYTIKGKTYIPDIKYSRNTVTITKKGQTENVVITNTFDGGGALTILKELEPGYKLAGITNTTEFKFKIKGPDGYVTGSQTPAKTIKYTGQSGSGTTFSFSNLQSASISGLPFGSYSVEEVGEPKNCIVTYPKNNVSLIASSPSSTIIVNNEFKIDTGKIEINKELAGSLPDTVTNNTVYKVSLLNTKTGEYLSASTSGSSYKANGFSKSKSLINIKASMSTTISGVPVGTYTIKEEDIAGFTPEYSSSSITVTKDKTSSVTVKNVYDGSFTISKEVVNPPSGVSDSTTFKGTLHVNSKKASFTKSGNTYTYKKNGSVSDITFSVNNPALIKGLPVGTVLFNESSPSPAPSSIDYKKITVNGVVSGIKVINNYEAGAPIPPGGTPPGGGSHHPPIDAPSPSGEAHPCIWENPPSEKIETKLSLIQVAVNKVSDVSNSSETLLNRSGDSPEQLFNNPQTSIDYDYTSIEREHNFTLSVFAKQVVVEKHTWYTLTPGWHDVQFEKFEHGTGIGAHDGWQHANDGTYSYLSCGSSEHTHSGACYDEDNALVCGKSEHSHTSGCSSPGYYPCVHPKPCLHVVWKYPPAGLPQWQENIEYRVRDERTTTSYPDYTRIIPPLTYSYFYPFNIVTGNSETNNSRVNSYLSDTTSQRLLLSSNLYNTNTDSRALLGINNNSPIPFSIECSNDQFGIPLDGDGFKLEPSLPPEGQYEYEEQYYWNGKFYFGALDNSRANLPSISIVSLECDKGEKGNKESFPFISAPGRMPEDYLFRSIRTSDNDNYLLGVNNKPFWYTEFEYGLRYRYGIRYDITISTGMVTQAVKTNSWSTKHSTPPKSAFKSGFSDPTIRATASRVDDVWTGENHSRIDVQPIIYGEVNVKTVAGYNKRN